MKIAEVAVEWYCKRCDKFVKNEKVRISHAVSEITMCPTCHSGGPTIQLLMIGELALERTEPVSGGK